MKENLIPTVNGCKGVSLKEKVFLGSVFPFLNHFMPRRRQCYMVKTSAKRWPYTGDTYLQMVWIIKDLEELKENFLCTFKSLTIPSESLWIHHFFCRNQFVRIDEPSEKEEVRCFYVNSNEAQQKRIKYCEEKLGTDNYKTMETKLVVGEKFCPEKSRIVPFKITFTRNWKNTNDDFIGGILLIRFFHEVRNVGMLKGEFASGEEEDGNHDLVIEEINNDEVKFGSSVDEEN
jgi:hypothetical protein